jgi:cbb3-type cytochrome oxidase subunit 3
MRKYAYAWLTLGFFLVSFGLHWFFGWKALQDEARAHHEAVELNQYLVQMGRDTFENWQSEFLQLLWQVVGLAYFLYVGSPSSKENDDRVEAKIDELLKQLPDGDKLLDELDHKYLRTHGHARPHAHQGS